MSHIDKEINILLRRNGSSSVYSSRHSMSVVVKWWASSCMKGSLWQELNMGGLLAPFLGTIGGGCGDDRKIVKR